MVCADYSNAFDTVQFRSLVSKMVISNFYVADLQSELQCDLSVC